MEWQKSVKIPDGKHTGVITKIEERHEPFEYIDVFVKLDDTDIEIKYGCPAFMSEDSKLGRLMQTFGVKFVVGTKADLDVSLKGRKVEFMTLMKKSKKADREYSEIVEDSLKPIVEPEIPTQKM